MNLIAYCLLRALHLAYGFVLLLVSLLKRNNPSFVRRRVPKHLALILVAPLDPVSGESLVQCVISVAGWCQAVGIEKLTVYDEHGQVLSRSQQIHETLLRKSFGESSESEIEFPLTPPPSDYSLSRPTSPQDKVALDANTVTINLTDTPKTCKPFRQESVRRRRCVQKEREEFKALTLCLTSRRSSKAMITSTAQSLASRHKMESRKDGYLIEAPFTLTIDDLDRILDVEDGLSCPDFMIVHPLYPSHYNHTPLELHGYPPWHIRLTEIYHDRFSSYHAFWPGNCDSEPSLLPEATLNTALDEYAMAETRFGK